MAIEPSNEDLYEAGLAARKKVLGEQYVNPNIEKGEKDHLTGKIQTMVTEYCWGGAWTDDTLDHKTRSMLNLAILTALGKMQELKSHTRGALRNGCTVEEITEVLAKELEPGDWVLTLGAGDITRLGPQLLRALNAHAAGDAP